MPAAAIVADDFGMSTFRTDAIMESFYNGAISQASLMVTGDDAPRAVRLAKNAEHPHQLPLGLHFNITQGKCASEITCVNVNNNNATENTNETASSSSPSSPSHQQIIRSTKFLQFLREDSTCLEEIDQQEERNFLLQLVEQENIFSQKNGFFINLETGKFPDKVGAFVNAGNVGFVTTSPSNSSSTSSSPESKFSLQWRHRFTQEIWFTVVLEEFCAQLGMFEQLCGHFPFAVDGHHHIHVLPVVARVICAFYKSSLNPPNYPENAGEGVTDEFFSVENENGKILQCLNLLQRRIIDYYLPGSSTAAAVRALRYLRIPLPPLAELSRIEDWRSGPRDVHPTSYHNFNFSAIHQHTTPLNPIWTKETANGAPFFARLAWCAYHAMLMWERNGLFGAIEKVEKKVENDEQAGECSYYFAKNTSNSSHSVQQSNTKNNSKTRKENDRHDEKGSKQVINVVDTMSPFCRRGIVTSTTTQEKFSPARNREHVNNISQNISSVTSSSSSSSSGSISPAIIPRRLCSFATGNRVNVDEIRQALISLQKEEAELSLRRDVLKLVLELEEIQEEVDKNKKESSNHDVSSSNSSTTTFEQKLNLLKDKHLQLSRVATDVENYNLYRSEKIIGNEWNDNDGFNKKLFGYSLGVVPWATSCDEELEIMVHPSEIIPELSNQNNNENNNNQSILDFWYGQTREFYCAWSHSKERQVELDFLTTEKFAAAVSGANCVVACYNEYSSNNLTKTGGGRSTGRS